MIKKLYITLACISTLAYADQSLTVNPGWNLVGVNTTDSHTISDFTTANEDIDYVIGSSSVWYPGKTKGALTSLESGKAYWLHSSANDTITVTLTGPMNELLSNSKESSVIKEGWNFISLTTDIISDDSNLDGEISNLTLKGFTVNYIIGSSSVWYPGKTKGALTTISENSGYWINVSKVTDPVTPPTPSY